MAKGTNDMANNPNELANQLVQEAQNEKAQKETRWGRSIEERENRQKNSNAFYDKWRKNFHLYSDLPLEDDEIDDFIDDVIESEDYGGAPEKDDDAAWVLDQDIKRYANPEAYGFLWNGGYTGHPKGTLPKNWKDFTTKQKRGFLKHNYDDAEYSKLVSDFRNALKSNKATAGSASKLDTLDDNELARLLEYIAENY